MALIHAAEHRVAGVVAMAPFAFVERSYVEAIRDNAARDELRDRLRHHHDDVDHDFSTAGATSGPIPTSCRGASRRNWGAA
jgi:hypothetical protein